MVKLSVFSDDLAAGWERAVQVAQDVGVEGLEVRNVWGKSSHDLAGEPAYPDGYHQVRELVRHVHFGRVDYVWEGSEPTIPRRQVLEALVADGYDGWITIERNHRVRDPRDPDQAPELQQQTIGDVKAVRKLLGEIQSES